MSDKVDVIQNDEEDDWELWWDNRLVALQKILGPSSDRVRHSLIPFALLPELGGAADILYFENHIPGTAVVTAELMGCEDQIRNELGMYELLICHRGKEEVDWGADLISRLAAYTLEAELNPGETMDLGPIAPTDSKIVALLFVEYARVEVLNQACGLLLCLGITKEELQACRTGRTDELLVKLKEADVFPYTDLKRDAVIPLGGNGFGGMLDILRSFWRRLLGNLDRRREI